MRQQHTFLYTIKRFAALLVAAATLFALAACRIDPGSGPSDTTAPAESETQAPGPGATVEGSVVLGIPAEYGEAHREALKRYVDAFRAEFPKISVKVKSVTDARSALTAEPGSSDHADVVYFPGEATFAYAYTDRVLLELGPAAELIGLNKKDVYPGVYRTGTVDGRLYSAGAYCDPLVLICDRTAFEALLPGRALPTELTMASMLSLCGELYAAADDRTGLELELCAEPVFLSLMRTASASSIEEWTNVSKCSVQFTYKTDDVRSRATVSFSDLDDVYETCRSRGGINCGNTVFEGRSLEYEEFLRELKADQDRRTPVFKALFMSELTAAGAELEQRGAEWDVTAFPSAGGKPYGGSNRLLSDDFNDSVAAATDCLGVRADTSEPTAAGLLAVFLMTEKGQRAFNAPAALGCLPALSALTDDLFLSAGNVLAGKNKIACTANLDDSVPAYFDAYVPPEISKMMREDLVKTVWQVIGVKTARIDLTTHMQDRAVQNWIALYHEHTGS